MDPVQGLMGALPSAQYQNDLAGFLQRQQQAVDGADEQSMMAGKGPLRRIYKPGAQDAADWTLPPQSQQALQWLQQSLPPSHTAVSGPFGTFGAGPGGNMPGVPTTRPKTQ